MTAPGSVRYLGSTGQSANTRILDLAGSATHLFQFATAPDTAYTYFADVPSLLRLLPDTLDVKSYADDVYRLIVGASDHHGHSMTAVFDLQVVCEEGRILLFPINDLPDYNGRGITFPGELQAEAIFRPGRKGTVVEYNLDVILSIPLPRALFFMPQNMLQSMGEHAMSFKITHMISGFAQAIETDFMRRLRRQ